jgi:hypothetical protein
MAELEDSEIPIICGVIGAIVAAIAGFIAGYESEGIGGGIVLALLGVPVGAFIGFAGVMLLYWVLVIAIFIGIPIGILVFIINKLWGVKF